MTDWQEQGAYAHDIGHLPFGHDGELALGEILQRPVEHARVGVLIARKVERRGRGLNLTRQTLETVLHHSSGKGDVVRGADVPEEANVVKWADKIAYVFGDITDFNRAMHDIEPALVKELVERASPFGTTQRMQVATCVQALVDESVEMGQVSFSQSECAARFDRLRKWMYANAYFPRRSRSALHETLYRAYDLLGTCEELVDCDTALLLSLLTDSEARYLGELSSDRRGLGLRDIASFGIAEIYPHVAGVSFDLDDMIPS